MGEIEREVLHFCGVCIVVFELCALNFRFYKSLARCCCFCSGFALYGLQFVLRCSVVIVVIVVGVFAVRFICNQYHRMFVHHK